MSAASIGFAPAAASGGGGGPDGNSAHASANSSGNTAIAPSSGQHIETITLTGVARTSIFPVAIAGRQAGDVCKVIFIGTPASGVRVQVTNNTAGGTVIFDYTFDGSVPSGKGEMYYDGAAWKPVEFVAPAFY